MNSVNPYRELILEHFRRPRNYGPLPAATAAAEGSNPLCGDRVRIAITLDATRRRIEEARFTANACAICVASASLLTERMRGMPAQVIAGMADDDIVAMLGAEIPPARRRCAALPLETARRALEVAIGSSSRVRGAWVESIVGVVLAAGSAQRFGGAQKLLAEVPHADPAQASVVRLAVVALQRAGLRHLVVVTGRDGDRVRDRLHGLDVEIVNNDAYAEGMSTSVRSGVAAVLERFPEASGILIALGDQPLLDDRLVPSIAHAFESATGAQIVAPRYRGARGNPVAFSRELVRELLAVSGDQGARAVIERDPSRVLYVDFDIEAPIDVDTPDDIQRLANELSKRSADR
jgi:molybdenum cofactor cytidylyltransferase